MRLGMMQPYFFPYLGYFGLIHATDMWLVFDTAQYIRRGWVNRNRILAHCKSRWKYARVPVAKTDRSTPIKDVKIASTEDWKNDLLNQFEFYRLSRAPYYEATLSFVEGVLDLETENLGELLTHCLRSTCCLLDIPFNFAMFSDTDLPLTGIQDPGDWALEASRSLGATEYINPPGGRGLFKSKRFADAGVTLKFLQPSLQEYRQKNGPFVAGLSIIDVMMWNDIPDVQQLVASYQLSAA